MLEFITGLVIGVILGVAGGWYAKTKFGAKVQAVEDAAKKV